jgi:hypothetical protein
MDILAVWVSRVARCVFEYELEETLAIPMGKLCRRRVNLQKIRQRRLKEGKGQIHNI